MFTDGRAERSHKKKKFRISRNKIKSEHGHFLRSRSGCENLKAYFEQSCQRVLGHPLKFILPLGSHNFQNINF